jgi:hypothetical protein
MANGDLVSQRRVAEVLGAARLKRLARAGWISPAQRSPSRVFYRVSDIHAALRRLERGELCPPDQIESARTNRNYVPKEKKARTPVWDLNLDLSALTGSNL